MTPVATVDSLSPAVPAESAERSSVSEEVSVAAADAQLSTPTAGSKRRRSAMSAFEDLSSTSAQLRELEAAKLDVLKQYLRKSEAASLVSTDQLATARSFLVSLLMGLDSDVEDAHIALLHHAESMLFDNSHSRLQHLCTILFVLSQRSATLGDVVSELESRFDAWGIVVES